MVQKWHILGTARKLAIRGKERQGLYDEIPIENGFDVRKLSHIWSID